MQILYAPFRVKLSAGVYSVTQEGSVVAQALHLPLPTEAAQAVFARDEVLHKGLFKTALLGDQPVQPAQQRIHIAQGLRDGTLFRERWHGNLVTPNLGSR